jgi:nicotinate-nucleotide--dimethylbenzimidazole phosphoribosyltransferase
MNDLSKITRQIEPLHKSWLEKAAEHQDRLTKPPHSLGKLEAIACRMAAIQQTLTPHVDRKRIIICAGDHGVTEEGISPYPSEVTAQMVANFLAGGAAINALAQTARADLLIVNAGVRSPIPQVDFSGRPIQFLQKPIRRGSRNFAREPALTSAEVMAAIELGLKVSLDARGANIHLLGLGEMGIGNTTAASAITVALTGIPAAKVTGRGTGASDAILEKKRMVVDAAVRLHAPDPNDSLQILQAFGGLEIAAMVGVCLGAAAMQIAVVCDGFISTASAALAVRIAPAAADYMFAGHLSVEPGHAALLRILGQEPLLNLDMRLGEGTGAALAMNIIDAAVRAFTQMATFESAGVSDKQGAAQATENR